MADTSPTQSNDLYVLIDCDAHDGKPCPRPGRPLAQCPDHAGTNTQRHTCRHCTAHSPYAARQIFDARGLTSSVLPRHETAAEFCSKIRLRARKGRGHASKNTQLGLHPLTCCASTAQMGAGRDLAREGVAPAPNELPRGVERAFQPTETAARLRHRCAHLSSR